MKNVVLTISYDGTRFAGFQRQKDQRTVQGVLEEALKRLEGLEGGNTPKVTGSGRTDTGVHALGQVVNYFSEKDLPKAAYLKGLNSLLPPDLVVRNMETKPLDFNARKSAKAKEYHYWLRTAPTPSPLGFKALMVNKKLDLVAMQSALGYFIGTHDFEGFRSTGSSIVNTVRTIYDADLFLAGSYVVFTFLANGFLYNMVRIIMGTLMEVGTGKIDARNIPEIIKSLDRNKTGPTIGPDGLYLYKVYYENRDFNSHNEGLKNNRAFKCHLDIYDYFT